MSENKRFVYADNAATTKVDPVVLEAMMPYLTDKWGNPSSAYSKGREAAGPLTESRAKIASLLGCKVEFLLLFCCVCKEIRHRTLTAHRGV